MYRSYGWNNDQRRQLLIDITKLISSLERIVDEEFIRRVMATFMKGNVLNLKASNTHPFGYVIYPK